MSRKRIAAWECRYIVERLPSEFLHDAVSTALGPRWREVATDRVETDDYLLAATPKLNIKVRHSSNSLKLKSQIAAAQDGLEHWSTDFEQRFPVASHDWSATLRTLGCDLDPDRFAELPSAEQVVRLFHVAAPGQTVVRVDKVRTIYGNEDSRIELAKFAVAGIRFETLCVESATAERVRTLLTRLNTSTLGRPRNYMEVLHELES